MKKIILTLMLISITAGMGFAADKCSKEYLQNNKHFAVLNPVAESVAEQVIKKVCSKIWK